MSERSAKPSSLAVVMIGTLVLLAACAKQQAVTSDQDMERGRSLYLTHCAICHGERGDGKGIRHAGLGTKPRNFRNRRWRARTSPRKIEETIRNGVPGFPMRSFRILTDEQVRAVAAYVLGF